MTDDAVSADVSRPLDEKMDRSAVFDLLRMCGAILFVALMSGICLHVSELVGN
ncbi:MAG: hypothetical protein SOH81_12020 [Acetobacter sp.]|jgi:hypothetical protein|nr:hypothetical protein [Acetobacter sp.]MCH4061041.1 hypothetical protein [Acetobacter sp.]MCH4087980.1 hypothetical protein [Acetobacter sp.]MCI1293407.1 hypothetical protein [Acetobacter sp.]MCI1319968.1 hypothetical protein [Acetobacter sp.]